MTRGNGRGERRGRLGGGGRGREKRETGGRGRGREEGDCAQPRTVTLRLSVDEYSEGGELT